MKESLRERLGSALIRGGTKIQGIENGHSQAGASITVISPVETDVQRDMRIKAEVRAKADAEKKNLLRQSAFFVAAHAVDVRYGLSEALSIGEPEHDRDFFTERIAMNLVSAVQTISAYEHGGKKKDLKEDKRKKWQDNYFLPFRTSDSETPQQARIDYELDRTAQDVTRIICQSTEYDVFRGALLDYLNGSSNNREVDLGDPNHFVDESSSPLAEKRVIIEAGKRIAEYKDALAS